jgi:hypothetical protein
MIPLSAESHISELDSSERWQRLMNPVVEKLADLNRWHRNEVR